MPSRSWNVPVGPVTLDCAVLAVPDTDLYVIVFTTEAGTPDASRLDLLRVMGTQPFVHMG